MKGESNQNLYQKEQSTSYSTTLNSSKENNNWYNIKNKKKSHTCLLGNIATGKHHSLFWSFYRLFGDITIIRYHWRFIIIIYYHMILKLYQ
jgi:hypothetical protein